MPAPSPVPQLEITGINNRCSALMGPGSGVAGAPQRVDQPAPRQLRGSHRPRSTQRATRMHEVTEIRIKYPNKIPVRPCPAGRGFGNGTAVGLLPWVSLTFSPLQVVVERYQREKTLPPLSRTKFLVSQDLPLSQFAVTLRTRLCLASSQTFYLLVNNKGLPNMAITMQELYQDNKDEDGFLYLTYASQEMFGGSSSEPAAA
ncbi:microtubule-associated protein 1 light chain 3 gamma-like [Porphyrio hochstetteri]